MKILVMCGILATSGYRFDYEARSLVSYVLEPLGGRKLVLMYVPPIVRKLIPREYLP